jgi:cytochrome c1
MKIAEGVGSEWLGCCVTNASKTVESISVRSIRVDDAAELGCRDMQTPIPTFAFGGYLKRDRARYSAWQSTNFATPRAALSAFCQFRPYHWHESLFENRDLAPGSASVALSLSRRSENQAKGSIGRPAAFHSG